MLTQDQKWTLMTTIGIPWTEFKNVSDDDLSFLLEKAEEIQKQMNQHQQRQGQGGPPQQQGDVQLYPPNYS